ncbi:MAG: hypothetical protein Q4D65_04085 [Peptostreptococcaceae bacterium]|nr:hypothetical protein [Peptostreptococcaceae bacterium]
MEIRIGKYVLTIDEERTKDYYRNKAKETDCICEGCENYRAFGKLKSHPLADFLKPFGLSIEDCVESSAIYAEDPDFVFYDVWYHCCGEILSVEQEPVNINGIDISFSDNCHLLEEDFPLPAIQINLWLKVPWLLACENTYLDK